MKSLKKQKHSSSNKKILEAAQKGDLAMIEFLHKRGLHLSLQDKLGSTALHYAAANGQVNVIKYLESAGVDLSSKDNKGATVTLCYSKWPP